MILFPPELLLKKYHKWKEAIQTLNMHKSAPNF